MKKAVDDNLYLYSYDDINIMQRTVIATMLKNNYNDNNQYCQEKEDLKISRRHSRC